MGETRLGWNQSHIIAISPTADHRACLAELRPLNLAPAHRAELAALERESDPEIFYRDLFNLGLRLEAVGRLDAAAEIYAKVANSTYLGDIATAVGAVRERPLRIHAQQQLDAILGRGALGPRAEFLLRHLTQQASDPAMIFAMGAAGTVFKLTRLATLRGLLSAPSGLLTRGLGARAASTLAGFAVEAPAFTLSGRFASVALGRSQDWSGTTLIKDLASSYLVLGGLKFAGWASGSAFRGVAGSVGAVRERPLQALFQQGGMLAGIYLGHGLEQHFGLKPTQDGATTLIDSLALLLQFHVAGRLGHLAFGRSFDRWQRQLDLQSEQLGHGALPFASGPRLALAVAGDPISGPRALNSFMAEHHEGGAGAKLIRTGQGSDPPPDSGVLGRDAARWGAAKRRDPEDVRLIGLLAAQIRVQMWNALNLKIEGLVARAIARRKEVLVRVLPVDGSLENLRVELHPKDEVLQTEGHEIHFLLNTATGALKLQDYLPNAVWEMRRRKESGQAPGRGFLPFYRSLQGFVSEGLKSEPLMDTLPPAAQEYLLLDPTRQFRRVPAPVPEPAAEPQPAPAAAPQLKALPSPSLLVRFFPRILAGVREDVDQYLDYMMIRGEKEKQRLYQLSQHILLALHQREVEDPNLGMQPHLQIWIRPSPLGGGKRHVEILTPTEAVNKNLEQPYGPEDILLVLRRTPGYLGEEYPTLEHHYLRRNKKIPSIPAGEDLEFQRDLGLGDQLRFQMRIDHLSRFPNDLESWRRWMKEHDQ